MRRILYLITVILILSGCATAPVDINIPAKPTQDDKTSSYLEQQLGYAGYYYMALNFKFSDDIKTANRLKRIGARITHYTERPELKYGYFIIDTEIRTAFAIPDGYIFISNSMVDTLKEDEKIAAVLAHEIAHINHKHSLEMYERKRGNKIIQALSGKEIVTIATEIGNYKACEFQADQTALCYLYRAGFDPSVFIETLKDTKQIEKEDEEKIKNRETEEDKKRKDKKQMDIFSRHPYIENRIVNAMNYLPTVYETEEIKYRPEDFNF